jgi:hypothetical protein
MSFSTTPRTLLGRFKRNGDEALQQSSLDECFSVCHLIKRVCVVHYFTRRGWHSLFKSDDFVGNSILMLMAKLPEEDVE